MPLDGVGAGGLSGVGGAAPVEDAEDVAATESQQEMGETQAPARTASLASGGFAALNLQAQLEEQLAGAQAAAAAEPPFDPEAMPEIGPGTKDSDTATLLQNSLNDWRDRLGKDPIKVDGKYAGGTKDTLIHYQKSMGLPATGTCDRETWRALAGTLTPKPPLEDPARASGPGQKGATFDPATMPTVKMGVKDDPAAKELQEALNVWRGERNLDPLKEDGDYGAKTRDALKQFQRTNGLPQTGVAGPEEWKALASVEARQYESPREERALDVPWISQYDQSPGRVDRPGDTACFRTSKAAVNEYLAGQGIDAHLNEVYDRIDVGRRENAGGDVITNKQDANDVRNYVDRCLDANLPAIVGISHEAGNAYNANAVTDHFVVITGRGVDADGKAFYTFNDPSRNQIENGQGKFTIDSDGKFEKAGGDSGLISSRKWEVSEVRTYRELP